MRWGIGHSLTCAFACAGWASCALGQEQDTQLWVNAASTHHLSEETQLILDASWRFRERARGDEQVMARFTVLQTVADGVRIGGGGAVFETEGGATELRPHQEIDLAFGRFSARSRIEERFFEGADRMELRVRQRIGYALPVGKAGRLSLDGEYLHLAQTRERGGNRPRDEWRARAIASAKVSDRLTLGLGYLAIHTPREGARDRLTHIGQTHLNLAF